MKNVFANRSKKGDFIVNEMEERGCDVYIASAFFTHAEVVEKLLDDDCRVLMIIRLGFPTSPDAIKQVINHPNIQLRIYTGHSFHPKLYIFGEEFALVGSANLTRSALLTNQEVMVRIDSADEKFSELMEIFDEYWDGAEVPTEMQLSTYKALYSEFAKHQGSIDNLGKKVLEKLGETAPNNIDRGNTKASKQSVFLSSFRRSYQECVSAFDVVRGIYKGIGYRKASEEDIPLRLEIDSFISYVRERHAIGQSWNTGPYRSPREQEEIIQKLIREWSQTAWPYFEETIVGTNYPRLKLVFASPDTIADANDSDLFDALATLHSFHDRYRFFDGGLLTWKSEFPTFNDPKRTRETLAYLVHGKGDIVERMANAIYSPSYKLNEFGKANVQELVGWCNREELPILNGRTTKILRYFGSKVRQL
ncbi:phospholipase D-like domain-containing protein [Burkholderia ambifaria]|uniref:phospholipase D-like domain-containing protein n=1 Tax=Burkholderia ambifaria TaxID=152480 RepID=UPI001B99D4B7|nr:phospholipase D-like domain-containing protein [Burkholderia ambifaria]MBR8179305.1 hypothetical protein [Burkholderia ambifaria]